LKKSWTCVLTKPVKKILPNPELETVAGSFFSLSFLKHLAVMFEDGGVMIIREGKASVEAARVVDFCWSQKGILIHFDLIKRQAAWSANA
jgi:hypothetical protein